jgi:hypothetical protein
VIPPKIWVFVGENAMVGYCNLVVEVGCKDMSNLAIRRMKDSPLISKIFDLVSTNLKYQNVVYERWNIKLLETSNTSCNTSRTGKHYSRRRNLLILFLSALSKLMHIQI